MKNPVLRKRFQEVYDRCAKIVPGSPAFDFMFTDIAGQAVELEDFRGKYLFINVWTTWGVPCRYENLAWEKLEKEFEDDNIVFVAVSCDRSFFHGFLHDPRSSPFHFDRSGRTYYQLGYVTTF